MSRKSTEITSLLRAWEKGEPAALDRLTALVHHDLRQMAKRWARREYQGNPVETTELLNEAYVRLIDARDRQWHDRIHFFAVAAQIMRRILVDAARTRLSQKRGAGAKHIGYSTAGDLLAAPENTSDHSNELLKLEDALKLLDQKDARKAKVVELRFFGGLSVEETAEVLKMSPQTVMRDWRLARVWLARELRGG